MNKLKIGQKIKVKHKIFGLKIGDKGIIRIIDDVFYGIEFEKYVDGHELNYSGRNYCTYGYGYWLFRDSIIPVFSCKRIN
jgi:hypothetical protein